jgi:hypothetical protein
MKPNSLEDFMNGTAKALGRDWSASLNDYGTACLEGPEGCSLFVRPDHHEWVRADRVEVSGSWPRGTSANGSSQLFAPYHDSYSITAALSRGPAAVARDIERRLLPGYLPRYREMVARRDRHVEEELARLRAAQEIRDLLRIDPSSQNPCEFYLPDTVGYGQLKVEHYGGQLQVEFSRLQVPYDRALSILTALFAPGATA